MPPSSILLRLSPRIPPTTTRIFARHAVPRFPAASQPQSQSQSQAAFRVAGSRTIMASAGAAPVQEWLVIAPDREGALEKRLEVRGEHLGGLQQDPEGFWLFGGAMLEEPLVEGQTPTFKGSAMLIGAKTREEVVERLKKDVYVKGSVWDWDKVQIIPFKSAIRKAL